MNLNEAAENAFNTALLREKHGAVLKIREILKHCAGEVIEAQQARDNWIACGGDYEAQEKDDYAKELADVIICVLIAAKHDSINIETAVNEKMQINAQRAAMQGDKL